MGLKTYGRSRSPSDEGDDGAAVCHAFARFRTTCVLENPASRNTGGCPAEPTTETAPWKSTGLGHPFDETSVNLNEWAAGNPRVVISDAMTGEAALAASSRDTGMGNRIGDGCRAMAVGLTARGEDDAVVKDRGEDDAVVGDS